MTRQDFIEGKNFFVPEWRAYVRYVYSEFGGNLMIKEETYEYKAEILDIKDDCVKHNFRNRLKDDTLFFRDYEIAERIKGNPFLYHPKKTTKKNPFVYKIVLDDSAFDEKKFRLILNKKNKENKIIGKMTKEEVNELMKSAIKVLLTANRS